MSEPHERLAQAMATRSLELKKRWVQIAREADVTTSALGAIRRGEYRPSAHTSRGIEDALEWEPGSIDAILEGGEPTPAPKSPKSPVEQRFAEVLADHVGEDEFDRLDRLYEEWKRDPARGAVLRELLETWGERDAG